MRLGHTVHPKVDHSVGLVAVLQPLVHCGVLGVRGEVPLEQEPHRVTFEAQKWLNT
jgi:hypothetical protein